MKFLNGNGQQEVDAFLYHLCNLLAAVEESKHEQSVSDKLNKKLFNDNAIEFKTNLLTFVKSGDHIGFNFMNVVAFTNKANNIVNLVKSNYKEDEFKPVCCHLDNKQVHVDDLQYGLTYALVTNPHKPWDSVIGFCKYIGNGNIYVIGTDLSEYFVSLSGCDEQFFAYRVDFLEAYTKYISDRAGGVINGLPAFLFNEL
jgi:hypothetical protein